MLIKLISANYCDKFPYILFKPQNRTNKVRIMSMIHLNLELGKL